MYKIPFADPFHDRDDHCGEASASEIVPFVRKTTSVFWPFIGSGQDSRR
jgi:hypothetical protein